MKKVKLIIEFTLMSLLLVGLASAQCPVPAGLTTVSSGTSSAQLNWTAQAGATGYRLEVQNGQNNPVPFSVVTSSATNTYSVSGLTPGSIYKFKVRTLCQGGDKSGWSAWFTFAAGGGAVNCVQISGLTVTNSTAGGASFTWNASAGGLGYAVRVEDASGNPVDFLFNATTTTNSYSMTGLNPSSNYKVKVRKRCAPGIAGPWSAWVNFTTTAMRLAVQSADPVSVYPNPAGNDFTVVNNNGISRIEVYDISGRLVLDKSFAEASQLNRVEMASADIPEGLYFVRVYSTEAVSTERLTIVH